MIRSLLLVPLLLWVNTGLLDIPVAIVHLNEKIPNVNINDGRVSFEVAEKVENRLSRRPPSYLNSKCQDIWRGYKDGSRLERLKNDLLTERVYDMIVEYIVFDFLLGDCFWLRWAECVRNGWEFADFEVMENPYEDIITPDGERYSDLVEEMVAWYGWWIDEEMKKGINIYPDGVVAWKQRIVLKFFSLKRTSRIFAEFPSDPRRLPDLLAPDDEEWDWDLDFGTHTDSKPCRRVNPVILFGKRWKRLMRWIKTNHGEDMAAAPTSVPPPAVAPAVAPFVGPPATPPVTSPYPSSTTVPPVETTEPGENPGPEKSKRGLRVRLGVFAEACEGICIRIGIGFTFDAPNDKAFIHWQHGIGDIVDPKTDASVKVNLAFYCNGEAIDELGRDLLSFGTVRKGGYQFNLLYSTDYKFLGMSFTTPFFDNFAPRLRDKTNFYYIRSGLVARFVGRDKENGCPEEEVLLACGHVWGYVDESSVCFLDVPEIPSDRWGWALPIEEGVTVAGTLYAEAGACDTDKAIEVGSFTVELVGCLAKITCDALPGYRFDEIAFNAGPDPYAITPLGDVSVTPRQFDDEWKNLDGNQTTRFVGYSDHNCDTEYVIVHAWACPDEPPPPDSCTSYGYVKDESTCYLDIPEIPSDRWGYATKLKEGKLLRGDIKSSCAQCKLSNCEDTGEFTLYKDGCLLGVEIELFDGSTMNELSINYGPNPYVILDNGKVSNTPSQFKYHYTNLKETSSVSLWYTDACDAEYAIVHTTACPPYGTPSEREKAPKFVSECPVYYGYKAGQSLCFQDIPEITEKGISKGGFVIHVPEGTSVSGDIVRTNSDCEAGTDIGDFTASRDGCAVSVNIQIDEPSFMDNLAITHGPYPYALTPQGEASVSPGQFSMVYNSLTDPQTASTVCPWACSSEYVIIYSAVCTPTPAPLPPATAAPTTDECGSTFAYFEGQSQCYFDFPEITADRWGYSTPIADGDTLVGTYLENAKNCNPELADNIGDVTISLNGCELSVDIVISEGGMNDLGINYGPYPYALTRSGAATVAPQQFKQWYLSMENPQEFHAVYDDACDTAYVTVTSVTCPETNAERVITKCEPSFAYADEGSSTCYFDIPEVSADRWGYAIAIGEGGLTTSLIAEAGGCIVEKSLEVGSVDIFKASCELSITLNVADYVGMSDLYIHYGPNPYVDTRRGASVFLGQFPLQYADMAAAQTFTVTVTDACDAAYVIVYSEVCPLPTTAAPRVVLAEENSAPWYDNAYVKGVGMMSAATLVGMAVFVAGKRKPKVSKMAQYGEFAPLLADKHQRYDLP